MYLKPKRLVNSYEERMLEFLQTCIDDNYKVHPQVSLSQIGELDPYSYIDDYELRQFYFSASVDAVITDLNFMPCLAVEFQSSYHDNNKAKNRDIKKAKLLSLAKVPLIYSRVKDFGLLCLYSQKESVTFNLFTGEGKDLAFKLIKNIINAKLS